MTRPRTLTAAAFVAVAVLAHAAAEDPKPVPGLTVDKDKKLVAVAAKVAPRKLAAKEFEGKVYPIEVIACFPYAEGKQRKAHETVLTTDVNPSDVHKAIESLGVKPGKPAKGDEAAEGPELRVFVEVAQPDGTAKRLTLDKILVDPKTDKPMPKMKFLFVGSPSGPVSPDDPKVIYKADVTGTLLTVFPVTESVVQSTLPVTAAVPLEVKKGVLPKENDDVKLILEVVAK